LALPKIGLLTSGVKALKTAFSCFSEENFKRTVAFAFISLTVTFRNRIRANLDLRNAQQKRKEADEKGSY